MSNTNPDSNLQISLRFRLRLQHPKKNKRENDKREETKEIFKFYLIHNFITESVQHGLAMRFPRLGVILCTIFTMLIMLSPALGVILKRRVPLSPAKSKQKQT